MAMAKASNLAIAQAMFKNGVFSSDNRIPKPTADNIASIQQRILDYYPSRNNYMEALINQIWQREVQTTIFRSPLGILKSEPMRYGYGEQEIFVNMIKGYAYDEFAGVDALYRYYNDQVMAAYHILTPAIQYASTFTFDNLRSAFLSEYGIRDLLSAKMQAMYSSAQYDEYLNTRALVESAYNAGTAKVVTIPANLTKDNAEDFTIQMKSYISRMFFPNPEWNFAGATSISYPNGVYYMTTPEYDSYLDVKVLATAYHDSRVSLDAQKIIVDKFELPQIKAALFDLRWFKVKDNFMTLSDSRNGASLTWNYFLTNSEMFSYSPFFNMIIFTTDATGVTGITVDANFAGVVDGTVKINYTVTGDGYVPQAVDFTISGNNSSHTFMIPGSNILKIGRDETSKSITVTITSREYPDVTATTTVTL